MHSPIDLHHQRSITRGSGCAMATASTPRHARRRTPLLARIGRLVLDAVREPTDTCRTCGSDCEPGWCVMYSDVLDTPIALWPADTPPHAAALESPISEYQPTRVVRSVDPLPTRPTPALAAPEAAAVEPVIRVRTDQLPLLLALVRSRQASAGHQVHRSPDAPCGCCAHLDFELAGVIDDQGSDR